MKLAATVLVIAAALGGTTLLVRGADAQDAPSADAVHHAKVAQQLLRERDTSRHEIRRLRRALRAARSRPEYVWWSTGDTQQVANAVFDEQGTPEWARSEWRCVFHNESGWRSDVWYGGAQGWQPQYAGSDRVNGVAQLRPYHADLVNDRVVSYATYLRTSDPVFSIRKALRLGFGPFFAQKGRCF